MIKKKTIKSRRHKLKFYLIILKKKKKKKKQTNKQINKLTNPISKDPIIRIVHIVAILLMIELLDA